MCKAAAAEIEEHWKAHCDKDGYGPINLVSRLKGEMKPDLYPAYDNPRPVKPHRSGGGEWVGE